MIESILYFLHYGLILAYGVALSCAFCGIRFSKKNIRFMAIIFAICGSLQLISYFTSGEDYVWMQYPAITHLPLLIAICLVYRKHILSAIAAIATAYMCCQLAKWLGIMTHTLSGNTIAEQVVRILTLCITGYLICRYIATYIAGLYNKETRSVLIFGLVPIVYYVFDYVVYLYSDFWTAHSRIAVEFLPFFLCIMFLVFCVIYYREQELVMDAKRREQMIGLTIEQQKKEMDAIRRSEKEIRLLRHDMRLLLNQIALSIENDDKETADKLISGYISGIDATAISRYCNNDTLNYVFALYDTKCKEQNIPIKLDIAPGEYNIDEFLFSSILSNALDNALNAQNLVPHYKRNITVWLKDTNGKVLLLIKNSYGQKPTFVDGVPIAGIANHGYGTQSIRYLTERLGGNCQFSATDTEFILKIVI